MNKAGNYLRQNPSKPSIVSLPPLQTLYTLTVCLLILFGGLGSCGIIHRCRFVAVAVSHFDVDSFRPKLLDSKLAVDRQVLAATFHSYD